MFCDRIIFNTRSVSIYRLFVNHHCDIPITGHEIRDFHHNSNNNRIKILKKSEKLNENKTSKKNWMVQSDLNPGSDHRGIHSRIHQRDIP